MTEPLSSDQIFVRKLTDIVSYVVIAGHFDQGVIWWAMDTRVFTINKVICN